ncbi:MAG: AraC family ligand binding domain-containing protein [Balneolaceae bacterium]|nr:AraC family ligand binding domain-containing protein [Balneolaceae bacterium]
MITSSDTDTNLTSKQRKSEGFAGQKMIVLPQKIISNLLQHPLLKTLFATHIGYFPKAKFHYRERNQGIDEFVLIYCIEGEGWYEVEEEQFEVRPNDFFILPAGFPHRYSADNEAPWEYLLDTFCRNSGLCIYQLIQK